MFPDTYFGPVYLHAWVRLGGVIFESELIDADSRTCTAQVIRRGTIITRDVPFSALVAVSLRQGDRVIRAFGPPVCRDAGRPVQ